MLMTVITGSNTEDIFEIRNLLRTTLHMKDIGQLTNLLGLEVHHQPQDIFLNQHKYILDLVLVSWTHEHYFC